MTARAAVTAQFRDVARQQERPLAPLADALPLARSGLDSLCFAIIVARLDDELGVDPFAEADEFPTTFGEFVALYERSLA